MRWTLLCVAACASPPAPRPVEVSKPDATEPVVDAAAEAETVAVIVDAAPEAAARPVCGQSALAHAAHVVRGKVRDVGGSEVRKEGSIYAVAWVIVDILEVLDGDGIAPKFQKSFYATTTTDVSGPGGHGFGGRGIATDLASRKGDELIFILTLPDRGGSEGGAVPARFLRDYGPKSPNVYTTCPLEERDAILSAKAQLRLRARPR